MTDIEAIAILTMIKSLMEKEKTDKSAIEAMNIALGAIHDRVVLDLTMTIGENKPC